MLLIVKIKKIPQHILNSEQLKQDSNTSESSKAKLRLVAATGPTAAMDSAAYPIVRS